MLSATVVKVNGPVVSQSIYFFFFSILLRVYSTSSLFYSIRLEDYDLRVLVGIHWFHIITNAGKHNQFTSEHSSIFSPYKILVIQYKYEHLPNKIE